MLWKSSGKLYHLSKETRMKRKRKAFVKVLEKVKLVLVNIRFRLDISMSVMVTNPGIGFGAWHTHSPSPSFFQNLPTLQYATPSIWPFGWIRGLQDRAIWEELCFENPIEEWVFIVNEPPSLFRKESVVEQGQVFEAHTPLPFRFTHNAPLYPMDLTSI